ncbi:hypothetical protein [Haliscomenobacter hydrossis]|uniref:Uncharacterized protein n=1 Tax=Haliscomenobacter hydrossis (strain ATCC 27775 / DSM 1100 / LMG 10767 / O) TaxID=760192 RepID=F4KY76_HALH1|nr:hypothetical protein [Haliscomenobacter hydrossis]AEE48339.1 hypothetical protein Halhy_0428 [Haliscomenobacter hydrossis DSM 1100]
MKNALFPLLFCLLCSLPFATAQDVSEKLSIEELALKSKASNPENASLRAGPAASDCIVDTCKCLGDFFEEIEVYYFGANNVTVDVYSDRKLSNLIASFPAVNNAQLLSINALGLPTGMLGSYTYLKLSDPGGEVCVTEIFSRCPINAWPGALEDLDILGKTYGYFTVYSHTTSEQKRRCTIDNISQDWHVGGNVVGPVKNTLGSRNAENVVLISSDLPRGVITKDGKFGINTQAPNASLEVNGDVRVETTLDVKGIATVHNTTAATTPANGALVVAGGVGIAKNLKIGADASIGTDLQVGEDLSVSKTASIGGVTKISDNTTSIDATTGALVVTGGVGVGGNLNVNNSLKVIGNTASTNATSGALVVTGGAGIGENLNVNKDLGVAGNSFLTGKVAIATTSTPGGHELYVGGSIIAEEVVVKLSGNWPDYVFDPKYPTPDLREWKKFIAENHHLPGMPSAQALEAQGSVALGETQRLLLEKVEQLLLIILEQQKQIDALKVAVETKDKP